VCCRWFGGSNNPLSKYRLRVYHTLSAYSPQRLHVGIAQRYCTRGVGNEIVVEGLDITMEAGIVKHSDSTPLRRSRELGSSLVLFARLQRAKTLGFFSLEPCSRTGSWGYRKWRLCTPMGSRAASSCPLRRYIVRTRCHPSHVRLFRGVDHASKSLPVFAASTMSHADADLVCKRVLLISGSASSAF
jgi:hypothetical protein